MSSVSAAAAEQRADTVLATVGSHTAGIFKALLWTVVFAALALFVIYPLAWLVVGGLQTEDGNWTLAHYARAVTPYYLGLYLTTLKYAVSVTIFSMIIGVSMAWAVARTDMPAKNLFRSSTAVAFVLPPLFQAVAFIVIFRPNAGIANSLMETMIGLRPFDIYTFSGLVFVTVLGIYPVSFFIVDGALRSMDPSLEDAAKIVGARPWRVVTRITLPLVAPAILTSAVFTIINTLAVFGPAAVIGIPAKVYVIATQIYIEMSSYPPQIEFSAAVSIIFFLTTMVLLWAQSMALRRRRFTVVSGKGMRARQMALSWMKWPVFLLCLLVVATALFLPAAVLFGMSVSQVLARGPAWDNLTARFYVEVFSNGDALRSYWNSIYLAVVSTLLALAAATVISYFLIKSKLRFKQTIRFVVFLPYSIPAIIFTVGVILAFIRPPLNLYGTVWIVLVCYFARFLPYAVQPLSDGLRQIDDSLIEASTIAGGSWLLTIRRIVLPLLKFTALSTGVLIFITCLRELVSIILLYSPQTKTALVLSYQLWDEGYAQITATLLVILLTLVTVGYFLARRITGTHAF